MQVVKGLVAALALAAAMTASAATISVNWNTPAFNPGGVNVGTITFPPSGSIGANAGRFEGTVTATAGISSAELIASPSDFFAYCYDLAQTLASGTTYTVGAANAAVLDFLGAVNSVLGGGLHAWLAPGSGTVAAAIQLGIWEGLHGDDFALTTGSVRFSNVSVAVSNQFGTFVAAMAASGSAPSWSVITLTSANTQDVITGRKVPEPGSLALFGLAALAAGFLRGRR